MFAVHVDGKASFDAALERLVARGEADLAKVEPVVREILTAVRGEGDAAVQRYAQRFQGRVSGALVRRSFGGDAALGRLAGPVRDAMELAATRIRTFHEHERESGFRYHDADGVTLGLLVRPLSRVAVYAPGGKARYPSSVLMSAIPAKVAGVPDVVLATPLAGDASDDLLYAAAHLAGVTEIFDCGGAQAIAALAYGTESVARVSKIVGPGNLYVACAKRLVSGAVAIEGIAGPSEILVLADDEADPRVVAADLISQAEHDEAAYPLLLCLSELMASAVAREISQQLETLPRADIARASLGGNGCALVVSSLARMARVASTIAAEHVSLQVHDADALLPDIHHAGAVFLGPVTPEAAGDYLAGPSHVLPTGSAVRFGAPLGVYDFVSRTSFIRYSEDALARHARPICDFARAEGLEGHARAVLVRLQGRR